MEHDFKKNLEGESQKSQTQIALSFEMTTFNFPLDCTCPLQKASKNRQFGKLLKLNIK